MATIKSVAINDTLSLDLHDDSGALYVTIRRKDGGLVRVELAELPRLIVTLMLAGVDLAERAIRNPWDE